MKKPIFTLAVVFLFGLTLTIFSCGTKQSEEQTEQKTDTSAFTVKHPEWSANAVIYEVNIRQYTKSGTFKEFETHIPRLKELGVDILWFMPIHPVGVKNRKGKLGSYYSVQDYLAVNPEFGTFQDFKSVVKTAHDNGMYVIIDWVANHTAWDHPWTKTNPDFYTKDSLGNFVPPIGTDWSDVIDLNYDNKNLWTEMTKALKFWVDSANIDGYRCDVADWVPMEFWDQARIELDKIKPVFMLAEAERPQVHHNAFDASYAWEFHHIMNKIAKKEKTVSAIDSFFFRESANYDRNAIRMQFVTNHDENSWNGTVKEKFGDGADVFTVLTYTVPGMPLIYSGQEVGLDKRLKFFEKDQIDWQKDKNLPEFYKKLNQLKKQNKALWNGNAGGHMMRIKIDNNKNVFAFAREREQNMVLVIANLSDKPQTINFESVETFKGMKSYFDSNDLISKTMELKPWAYKVFFK